MKRSFYSVLFSVLICGNFIKPTVSADEPQWLDTALQSAEKQLTVEVKAVDSARSGADTQLVSPRTVAANGKIVLVKSSDWCSGFFPGELWMMYRYTRDPKWKAAAERFTKPLKREEFNGSSHDVGFKVFCSFGRAFRETGNLQDRAVIVQAAKTLCTRFNPVVGCIRSWDFNAKEWKYPVIIDNMMNLELLYWASQETGNPRYAAIANSHAETTMKNHFRPDYSSYHVVSYNPETGKPEWKGTHQGYSNSSAWARGQGWGLYGFTMAYRYTGRPEYLKQAEGIAGFILNNPHLPKDGVPYWDFDDPAIPHAPRDASAGAIIACGLLELARFTPEHATEYRSEAEKILKTLSSKAFRVPAGQDDGFLLLHSVGSKPENSEVNVPLVYADYYYLEGLLRLRHWEAENGSLKAEQ